MAKFVRGDVVVVPVQPFVPLLIIPEEKVGVVKAKADLVARVKGRNRIEQIALEPVDLIGRQHRVSSLVV